ncbi:MAG: hypothetical protein ABI895_31975 [Deltaproteobacteria bacterium]
MTTQAAESSGVVTRILHPAITTDTGSFEAAARAAERVAVSLESPGPELRTHLTAFVLSSIETQLERLGAVPPGWTAKDSLEMVLSDQLYRSRLLGAGGIALKLGALDGIADAAGELSVEDSHALRRMFALAELEPLQVFLPEPSARLRVLGAPQRLSDWLPVGSRAGRVASIEYEALPGEGAPASASAAREESLAPPQLEAFVHSREANDTGGLDAAERQPDDPEVTAELSEQAMAEPSESERPTVIPTLAPHDSPGAPAPVAVAAPSPTAVPAEAETGAPMTVAEPARATPAELAEQQRRCAAWLTQLQGMRGPKQHASIERAFLTAYLPLAREMATGKAPPEIRLAVEDWAEGFAHSYASAFKTLNAHARRPTMVRDIFEVAQRWLNQYRARSFQILLVDSMRFDLGQRLNEAIERRLAGQAVCRDQSLLWAALPSNSVAQRLAEATPGRPSPPDKTATAADTSSATTGGIELLRIGSRELFRIDRLASDLAKPGELEVQRLERLASLLADLVVPWLKTRAPDTLAVVFGDHGFHWRAGERGTSAAQRGGALPEQVLVSASAWMLGAARPKAGLASGLH